MSDPTQPLKLAVESTNNTSGSNSIDIIQEGEPIRADNNNTTTATTTPITPTNNGSIVPIHTTDATPTNPEKEKEEKEKEKEIVLEEVDLAITPSSTWNNMNNKQKLRVRSKRLDQYIRQLKKNGELRDHLTQVSNSNTYFG